MGTPGPFGHLLHLGDVVVDVVVTVPALPEPGGDVLASQAETAAGGGFNVMAAAVRQGLPVTYAGAHGSGPFASLARAALAAEGIAVSQPPKTGLDTGIVISVVDATGERTFLTTRGAEATLTAEDLAPVTAAPGDAVYLSGYGLVYPRNRVALTDWLERLDDRPAMIFDPGPLVGSVPATVLDRVLARADWLTCNAREAALLTGSADPAAAIGLLAGRAGRAGILVRVGRDGCLIGGRSREPVKVPGFRVDVLDTNGAGDTHTGTFLAALAAGATPVEAVRRANAAAAISVTRHGPATAPTKKELAQFLASRSGD